MSNKVATALKAVEKETIARQQETLLAKTVQWTYGDETGQWIKFNPFMNNVCFFYFSFLSFSYNFWRKYFLNIEHSAVIFCKF